MLTKNQINKLLKDNKIDELIYLIENTHYNKIPYSIIYNHLRKNPNYELRMIVNSKYYKYKNYNSYIYTTYIPDYIKEKYGY